MRGHINGKDGVYAAALLVEMLAVTGRKLSEIYNGILEEFGHVTMLENNYTFRPERKAELVKTLMEEKRLPNLPFEVEKTSYMDGCKIYFKNGGWVCVRFSGTEPLLRVFCEMPQADMAQEVCRTYKEFLALEGEA